MDTVPTVRDYLINPAEGRLRAPWRIFSWIVLAGFGAVFIATAGTVFPLPSGAGAIRAVYGIVRQVSLIAGIVAVAVGIGYLLDRRTLTDYGLGFDGQWWRDAGFGVALGFGLPTLALAGQLAVGFTRVTGVLPVSPSDTFPFGTTGPWLRLALLCLFFLVQATAEEILVRGYLLTNLAEGGAGTLGRRASTLLATVVTGALFGLLHWNNPNATLLSVTNITLYGFLLGACYVFTGRLGIACGFHIAWNYTLSLWDFPVSGLDAGVALVATKTTGPSVITGGSFGLEGGLLALPLLAVGAGALGWWVRREYETVAALEQIAVPDLRAQD